MNCALHAVSVGKPSERMSNFWKVRFLKTESKQIFGFQHTPTLEVARSPNGGRYPCTGKRRAGDWLLIFEVLLVAVFRVTIRNLRQSQQTRQQFTHDGVMGDESHNTGPLLVQTLSTSFKHTTQIHFTTSTPFRETRKNLHRTSYFLVCRIPIDFKIGLFLCTIILTIHNWLKIF